MSKKQLMITFTLLALTVAVHYMIPQNNLTLHVIFRLLYLMPVAYVGLKTGKIGGFIMAVIAILLYSPHFLISKVSMEFQAGNIVAVVLMLATSIVTEFYRTTSEKKYLDQTSQAVKTLPHIGDRNILFYVENNPSSQYTSTWFAEYFKELANISITLFWVSLENVDDIFETEDKVDEYIKDIRQASETKLIEVKQTLVDQGYFAEKITNKVITIKDKIKISSVIRDELNTSVYDFVLVPKHKLTKAQEFLFGDTAIQVIRESGVPVLSVACDE